MTSGQTVGRKTRNPYAGSAVGIANRLLAPLLHSGGRRDVIDTLNAARISGSADIPLDLLPTILLIETLRIPGVRMCSIWNGLEWPNVESCSRSHRPIVIRRLFEGCAVDRVWR
jgi:hypothetical protein